MSSWSPYNYAFNNPVRFIDPDGTSPDDIIVTVRDESGDIYLSLDYRNDGNLYDVSGKLYEGDNTIVRGIQEAINETRASDEKLNSMFGELETSQNTHEWTNNNPAANTELSDNRDAGTLGNGTITQFRPEKNIASAKSKGGLVPTASDIAAHEGKHSYDRDKGKMRSRNPNASADGVSDAELDAINTERLNQKGQNRPLRKSFGGRKINPDRLVDPKDYNPLHKQK